MRSRTQPATRALIVFAVFAAAMMLGRSFVPDAHGQASESRWVTAWGTSQQAAGDTPISNATVRLIARPTIAGDSIRIRFDNAFGREPLEIGRAFAGHRVRGALLAKGSNRPVMFNGVPNVAIPAGGSVTSDPVALKVLALQDVAVSLFIAGTRVVPSQHTGAVVTSYRSPDESGDVAAAEEATAFTLTTTSLWWLKSIEVQASSRSASVVAFGDSITDGTCSTLDAHDRWEDVVAARLFERSAANRPASSPREDPLAVVNEGIGGNTLTRQGLDPPPDSPPALERIERDVLSHHGVSTVVLFMGTNDIRRGASANQVIQAMTTIAQKVKASGARVVGVTIIPRHGADAGGATNWDSSKTRIRNEVNGWIRGRAPFDAVIDFSKVVNDPADPDLILPAFNCGDGIHPSPRGYFEMGSAVDLSVLRKR
jgi:lysophospholipase L1-like esterase